MHIAQIKCISVRKISGYIFMITRDIKYVIHTLVKNFHKLMKIISIRKTLKEGKYFQNAQKTFKITF